MVAMGVQSPSLSLPASQECGLERETDLGVALAGDSHEPKTLSSIPGCSGSLLSALPALGTHFGQKMPCGILELELDCEGW